MNWHIPKIVILIWAAVIYASLALAAGQSGLEMNYHPVCGGGTTARICIDPEGYIQKRDDCDKPSERNKCFGVNSDGWDTWRMDSKAAGKIGAAQPFEYATIEYQSIYPKASRYDERQTGAVEARLRQLTSEGTPVTLVIFVHGWHHNAWENIDRNNADSILQDGDRPYNQDLNFLAFKHILAKTKYELGQQGQKKRVVLGVYIGWNGGPFQGLLNAASVARAADRVGSSSDFAQDMSRIKDAAAAAPDNNVLVIGHSFGGRLISRFMLSRVMAEGPDLEPFGPHALVTTINPAIGADAFDAFMQHSPFGQGRATPYWINVTSRDDDVTGYGIPVAASLGRLTGLELGITDKYFARSAYHTIGHFKRYQTHELEMPNIAAEDPKKRDAPADRKVCSAGASCVPVDGCLVVPSNLIDEDDRANQQRGLEVLSRGQTGARLTNWYMKSDEDLPLVYSNAAGCDNRFHFVHLKRLAASQRFPGSPNWMWNIRSDREGIDGGGAGTDCVGAADKQTTPYRQTWCAYQFSNQRHNAFVQTRFVRLFVELTLAQK